MKDDNLQESIDQVKADLEEGTAKPARKREVKKVAKKVVKKGKKFTSEEAKEIKAKKSNGASKHEQEDDGLISVADLADEAKISAQSARVKLRAAELDRGEGRWKWAEGSKGLKEARKILGLT